MSGNPGNTPRTDADGGSHNPLPITKTDIDLPSKQNKLAFVLDNVFSAKECKDFIQKTEKMGYSKALVNVGGGRQELMRDVRSSQRCIWDCPEEADRLWDRIKTFIPDTWAGRPVVGLNERLRVLRYNPGDFFAGHMDGSYRRDNDERSYITVHLYLNEGFKGGTTTFLDPRWNPGKSQDVECVPKTGSVLVFQHDILHEGSLLVSGRKYTVRTDVMYAPRSPQRALREQGLLL